MKRILTSLYGQMFGRTDDDRILAKNGFLSGEWGDQVSHSDTHTVALFDDFLGLTLQTVWGVHKGSDAGAANFAITGAASGSALGTTGATSTTMAGSGIQIDSALNWVAQGNAGTASSNNLEFNARVQVSAITGLCIFVGLTNEAGTLQMPIQGSGTANGFTANAANAVGFLYDTAMSTPHWYGISANASSIVGAGQDTGVAPVASTYEQFQISVDQLGNVNFFRNKAQVGVTVNAAFAPTTPMTPVVAAFSRIAASKNVLIDRKSCSMNRI